MSEWGVVGVLAALAALGATLLTPMLRLNGTMTRLAVLVEQLADRLAAFDERNARQHGELSGSLAELGGTVQGHETRITVLEIGGRKKGAGL